MTGLSLSAYARHRKAAGLSGGTLRAVQDAVRAKRIAVDERGKIPDAEVADEQWAATTHAEKRPLTGPAGTQGSQETVGLAEARARLDAAKAELAELELAERKGRLVAAADVESAVVGMITHAKTKLLGVPARARQQDPGLTAAQIALFDELIREALEDLAAGDLVPAAKKARRRR